MKYSNSIEICKYVIYEHQGFTVTVVFNIDEKKEGIYSNIIKNGNVRKVTFSFFSLVIF